MAQEMPMKCPKCWQKTFKSRQAQHLPKPLQNGAQEALKPNFCTNLPISLFDENVERFLLVVSLICYVSNLHFHLCSRRNIRISLAFSCSPLSCRLQSKKFFSVPRPRDLLRRRSITRKILFGSVVLSSHPYRTEMHKHVLRSTPKGFLIPSVENSTDSRPLHSRRGDRL